jgi:predicted MFS family arabinose efflux permease
LLALAAVVLLIVPLAFGLREPMRVAAAGARREQTIVQAVIEAFKYPSFGLLMAGYFVCGFQVVFIGVHMPSDLKDKDLSPEVASHALALIGLFNVFGTYTAGTLGQKLAKPKILAGHLLRACHRHLAVPDRAFVAAVGLCVRRCHRLPLAVDRAAHQCADRPDQIFGVAHLSMLSGFVFLGHQVGSFLGVWLGGFLYDRTGSYDIVWYIAIVLGIFAAIVNLPVRETPILRTAPQRG